MSNKARRGQVTELLTCAQAWQPDAHLLGNVTAQDICDVCACFESMRDELEYLIWLAESAMREANNDGAEYSIDDELIAARRTHARASFMLSELSGEGDE